MRTTSLTPVPGLTEVLSLLQLALKPAAKPNPFDVQPPFQWFVSRPELSDDVVEVAIEVTCYRSSGDNKYLDHRDPSFDPGYVEFGDANVVEKDGTLTPITLTQMELEAAERDFWNQ